MSRQIQIRRGTATQHNNFTGAIGEVTMDTTNKTLRVHDGSTLGGNEIMSVNKFWSYTTNCVIDIPQNIKVSYSGGVLTIKKGSKLYYPNGTGVFDNVVLESDETYTLSGTNTFYIFRRNASGTSGYFATTLSSIKSGTPDSSASGVVFYDTTNNRIDWYESGVRNDRLFSFPVCKISVSNGIITSIDEVFNGFGFIGNVIYALPGVKGLMPNGRNADGTIKRYLVNTSSVVLYKETSAKENYKLLMSNLGNWISSRKDCYIDYNNELRRVTDNAVVYSYVFGEFSSNATGKITNFNTKRVFFGLDANDTEYISNQAMPSKRYINLTLGTSGTTYTAPADGYFMFQKQASGDAQYANVVNNTNGLSTVGYPNANNYSVRLFLPVSKGDVVTINYTLTGTTNVFRFVYVNGVK